MRVSRLAVDSTCLYCEMCPEVGTGRSSLPSTSTRKCHFYKESVYGGPYNIIIGLREAASTGERESLRRGEGGGWWSRPNSGAGLTCTHCAKVTALMATICLREQRTALGIFSCKLMTKIPTVLLHTAVSVTWV